MIAVIFEAIPETGRGADYLEIAADLRPLLDGVDGFVSIERFESLVTPGKLLSLSFWRSEAAIAAWRNRAKHRSAQRRARDGIFRDYRIRVAAVLRDYGCASRNEAPADAIHAHGDQST